MGSSDLEKRLLEFDGVSLSPLSEARVELRGTPDFLAELIRFCTDPCATVARGASWMLKEELDAGAALPAPLTQDLVVALPQVSEWSAQLHLCQSMDHLSLDDTQSQDALSWAKGLINPKRPFLRAWSLHARVTLLRQLRDMATAEVERAEGEKDPAASVRARARQLR